MTEARHLRSLTGLRFVAATYVCLFHSTLGLTPFAWLNNIHAAGFTAVSLFFVLSGYVLAAGYAEEVESGAFDGRRFLARRLGRIGPLHWLALGACVAIAAAAGGPLPELGRLALCALFVETWLGVAEINTPAWSLSCEIFFYTSFGPIMRGVSRLGPGGCRIVIVLAFVLSLAVSLLACHIDGPKTQYFAWLPLARLPEFVAGVAAWRLGRCRPSSFPSPDVQVFASTALIVAVLANSAAVPSIVLHNSLLMLPFAALVDGLARGGGGPLQRLLASRTMGVLGEASFAFYVLQGVVADGVRLAARSAGLDGPATGIVWRILLLGVALAAWRYVEMPIRARVVALLPRRVAVLRTATTADDALTARCSSDPRPGPYRS